MHMIWLREGFNSDFLNGIMWGNFELLLALPSGIVRGFDCDYLGVFGYWVLLIRGKIRISFGEIDIIWWKFVQVA